MRADDRKLEAELAQQMADEFNAKHPIGSKVVVRRDDGTENIARVKYPAGIVGGRAVGWFEGIRGCYLLSRVSEVIGERSGA